MNARLNQQEPVVLVVEDDELLRGVISSLLRSVGLRVETFSSAAAFLDATLPPDAGCLILDIRLPGRSGLDLQADLLKEDIRIPIIFVSGHGDVPMTVRAMKAGAVDFLTKPFRHQDLLDAVTVALDLDRRRREDEKKVSTLQTDLVADEPRTGGYGLRYQRSDEQADRARGQLGGNYRKNTSEQRDEKNGGKVIRRVGTNGGNAWPATPKSHTA